MSDTNPQEVTSTDPLLALNTILGEIKREDGTQKYTDPVVAIKALKDSQEHIKVLEAKLKDVVEGKEKTAVEQILAKISVPAAAVPATPETKAGLTQDDVLQLLASQEAKTREAKNDSDFKAKLVEKYGDKAAEVLSAKAKELGVDPATIGNLAKTSPQAALAMLGVGVQAPNPAATRGTVNTSALPAGQRQTTVESPFKVGSTTDKLLTAWAHAKSAAQNQ